VRPLAVLGCFLCVAADWPQWRGPTGDGAVKDTAVPLRWSATENVAWKVQVPGAGHSSPIVVGGRVYMTAAIDRDRVLLAYDATTGKEVWRSTVVAADTERMHKNNTPASATPAADAEHVWTAFAADGKVVVSCHTTAGKPVWQKPFPGFVSPHGFCGSPVVWKEAVFVNGDSDGEAFLAALDRRTGAELWKVPRPNRTRSFSVPVVIDVAGSPQLVLAGSKGVAGFDTATGKQLWVADSPTDKFVSTVAFAGGMVAATGTSPVSTFVGIRPEGRGNVTASHVA
jgi:outer membrane protein assembly factor BamB